ncbi:hypothetical protein [uncultured Sulfitobacter sp.]|uniref:hypothetical protein n=1 Tax=uncultured Sulfitobacter sp. TaxID=191468 RepID=UPI002610D44A|nr:hypothetical protein [uncultured Sulfitobacter sp.]
MRLLLALSLCLLAGLAHAQPRITVALDGSFQRTTWGNSIKLGRDSYYSLVTFHRVVRREGRAYVCVAVANETFAGQSYGRSIGEEFASRSRVVTAQGAVVRRGLRGWTDLAGTPNAGRQVNVSRKKGEGTKSVTVFPAALRYYAGTPVSCRPSRRTPTPDFFTGDTRLVIPEEISYRVVQ